MAEGGHNKDTNNNPPEDGDEVDGKSSSSGRRPQRERSPSAVSVVSSQGLEWDPSADVGAMGTTASIAEMQAAAAVAETSQERLGMEWDDSADVGALGTTASIAAMQAAAEAAAAKALQKRLESDNASCDVLYRRETQAKSSKTSRPSSRSGNANTMFADMYSTPTSTPVPLDSLDYSPVNPEDSASVAVSARATGGSSFPSSRSRKGQSKRSNTDSSDSNNNDELTDGRRTPGRNVSEASTDWEYDNEKKSNSKYVADWPTNGITKSEIEYQNRKRSGSSTSMSSSTKSEFVVRIEYSHNQLQGCPGENSEQPSTSKSGLADLQCGNVKTGAPPSKKSTNTSELDRRIVDALTRAPDKKVYRKDPPVPSYEFLPPVTSSQFLAPSSHNLKSNSNHPDTNSRHLKSSSLNTESSSHHLKSSSRNTGSSSNHLKSSDDSDPSSMCVLVDKYLKILDKSNSKESVKYDVLKQHRDYHMSKVWKQIAKLEELNRALLNYKHGSKSKKTGKHFAQDAPGPSLVDMKKSQHRTDCLPERERYLERNEKSDADKRSDRRTKESTESKLAELLELVKRGMEQEATKCKATKTRQNTGHNAPSSLLDDSIESQRERYLERNAKSDADKRSDRRTKESTESKLAELLELVKRGMEQEATKCKATKTRQNTGHNAPRYERYNRQMEEDCVNEPNHTALVELIRRQVELLGLKAPEKKERTETKKSPIGYYIPLNGTDTDFVENKRPEGEMIDVNGPKKIQECLKERNPRCYQNIKERDEILITVKRDRQVHNESLLRAILENDLVPEEIEEYLDVNYRHDDGEKRRLRAFWEQYKETLKYRKEDKENEEGVNSPHVISTKEMKERTQRLRMNDPTMLEKQRKEAEERRKLASRVQQKNFSSNLRRFQRMAGGVNIPDRMKLGPRPRWDL